MRMTKEDPNVIRATTQTGLLKIFKTANTTLAKIHHQLEEFLETKRLVCKFCLVF